MDNQQLSIYKIFYGDYMNNSLIFGYVYLITNMINGHVYIGQHRHGIKEIDTTYKGSGQILKIVYEKYGINNFETTILDWCYSKEELDNKEIHWILQYRNELGRKSVYNKTDGGSCACIIPFTDEHRLNISLNHVGMLNRKHSEESKIKSRNSNVGQKRKDECKYNMSANHADFNGSKNPFHGIKHSEESKKLISQNHANMSGENNPTFGKKMMTDGNKNKFVSVSEQEYFLNNGWRFGCNRKYCK